MAVPALALYRLPQLKTITGLGASSIWARINPDAPQFDPDFPKPICLSATGKGAVAWRSDEIDKWIERRTILSRQSDETDAGIEPRTVLRRQSG